MKKIEDFYEIDNTKLQQSFITALKDKDFKAFVNTLDIKDRVKECVVIWQILVQRMLKLLEKKQDVE